MTPLNLRAQALLRILFTVHDTSLPHSEPLSSKLGYCGNGNSSSSLSATYVATTLESDYIEAWNNHLFHVFSGSATPGTNEGRFGRPRAPLRGVHRHRARSVRLQSRRPQFMASEAAISLADVGV